MKVAKNMDSVFAVAADYDSEFDVLFDQEDSLIDTVNGVNEAGDPLTGVDFEDLHQTQDDATVKDVKDGEGEDNKMGAPNPEGTKSTEVDDVSVKGEVDKESDADKFHGDAEDNYQEDKEKNPEPDENDLEKTIDKVVEGTDIDDIMMADDDDEEGLEEAKKCDSSEDEEECEEGCKASVKKESGLLIDSIEEEIDKQKDKPVEENNLMVESIEEEIQQEAKVVDSDVAKVDESDLDDEDDVIDAAIGNTKKKSKPSKYEYEPSDEDIIDMAINGK